MQRKKTIVISAFAICMMVWVACTDEAAKLDLPEKVSYNFHIRPILSDKCFACHGPDVAQMQAGLRLDAPEFAYAPLKESKGKFAIVPGQPDSSELIHRISSIDSTYRMPTPESHLGSLSPYEVNLFRKWIKQGAAYEPHWAFTPPKNPEIPKVKNKEWASNEIDFFVLNTLEKKKLTPNEQANKEYLLKRASLDLTGLPPTLDQMDRFLADASPKAYEKMVNELLASKHYGEKMALHWMDVARYSDSYGYQDDNIRTQWAWRDWVIHAFNKNQPYDEFITWQMAGDMLPDASKEQILATAFFRNHKYTEEGGVIPEEYRIEYILDKTKTYAKGILGLTLECAQCHDHKYDPISQKEYFQMFAFFNNTKEVGYEGDVSVSKPAKNPVMQIKDEDVKSLLSFINKKDTGNMTISVMGELDTVRKTYVLNRGAYDQPTEEVKPLALSAILPFDTLNLPRNRFGLAKWTTDKRNPLTSRVFVNQLWQELFGRGLVKTSGDFGMQGELPSHPELLDYLAMDFMNNGWDIKRLVKKITMSSTYKQSAKLSEEKLKADPDNMYLSRAPRIRIKAEMVKDLVLSSSGLLVPAIGGPSVKPYQPKGLWEAATSGRGELATYKMDKGESLYRRGMYTFIKLTVPPPGLMIFDASNRDQCEVKRLQTNTPLQALVMMNDPAVYEASRVMAERLMVPKTASDIKIKTAFRKIICRTPKEAEMKILLQYYHDQLTLFQQRKLDAVKTLKVGEYPMNDTIEKNGTAALMKTINTIYNMEEAITKS